MARGAALGTFAVGVLTLVGRLRDVTALTSVMAGFPVTSTPSSIALMLGGLSLGLRLSARSSALREALAVACALGMLAVGVVNLAQDLLGLDVAAGGVADAAARRRDARHGPPLAASRPVACCCWAARWPCWAA
ncbi:hypothetical protein ACLESD_51215, partial [Pyxidicoccus sp. 3LFB2]